MTFGFGFTPFGIGSFGGEGVVSPSDSDTSGLVGSGLVGVALVGNPGGGGGGGIITMPVSNGGWTGQSRGWRYLAQRIDGTGVPGAFLHNELPLTNVKITKVLSGPPQLTGTISPVFSDVKGTDGLPLLAEWGTVIHAECDGLIRASTIVVNAQFQGPFYSLDCSGFSGYAKGMAYPGNDQFINAEVLDVVRYMWAKIQADNGSNLNLYVDPNTVTGVRLGTDATSTDTTTTSAGPYALNWWTTTDIGGEIDKLAAATPFEYRERHQWSADGSTVDHFLDFGVPSIGRRRTDLRFVYGENIQTIPKPDDNGQDFANHVQVIGAGTGSAAIRKEARIADGRLRRMQTIQDSSITDPNEAATAARLELARRQALLELSEVAIHDSDHAKLGSFDVGDEIRVQAETDWRSFDIWGRVIQLDIDPESPDIQIAHLIRSDWVL